MRSQLFVSALTIALAVMTPIGWAIAFPTVAVAQSVAEQKKEADRLFAQGNQHFQVSQLQAAFQSWQSALKIYREIKHRYGEGATLGNSYIRQY